MIASDGGYADGKSDQMGHPRSTGTFPRVLGHYVREAKVLTLEEAVRKMTSLPADFSGLRDRGRIAEGQAADLVIFDPRIIIDRSTWDEPAKMPVGVRDVFVNGEAVLRNGELTGKAPGRYLRARR
jgi:N-acyl-D-aspartate/D-glutamate deacylase